MRAPIHQLPAAADLTYGQAKGWNCALCGIRLDVGAVSLGRVDELAEYGLDFEVWACPDCGKGGPS